MHYEFSSGLLEKVLGPVFGMLTNKHGGRLRPPRRTGLRRTMSDQIHVEVVYALRTGKRWSRAVAGRRHVREAVERSGLLAEFP
jgi:hypothetical protein